MKTLQVLFFCLIMPIFSWAQNSPQRSYFANVYQSDSITISGHILNRTSQTIPNIAQTHFITNELIKTPILVDSAGNFSVKVPAFNTTPLYIFYVSNGNTISMFAEPGEEIFIYSDWKNNQVIFKGKYAREHQEVFNYNSHLESINRKYTDYIPAEKISNDMYLKEIKRLTHQNDSILKAYIKLHPEISKRSIEEIRINNYNHFAELLMQRRFELDKMHGEKFSKDYMNYVDSIFTLLPQPYTIAKRSFIRNYLDYYSENQQMLPTFRQAVIDYAIQKKRIIPNEEQKKNPLLIITSEKFGPILLDSYNELKETVHFRRIMIDFYNGGALIRPMPDELREIATTQSFYRYLTDNRIALSKADVDYFKQQVKTPIFQNFVLDYQNKLLGLENGNLDISACLKDGKAFKDCKTGEEILALLFAPHKGKFIYLDIWGTWCAPCKKEMKFAENIKKTMEGKDIVFLYLANGSPETSWKNVIKENNLIGKQVEHYNLPSMQQDMIEKLLNIHYYPSYLIIDREGKIIEREALRPSSENELINHLNELLSK